MSCRFISSRFDELEADHFLDFLSSVPSGSAKLYRSPFFSDFWHLNVAMMTSNNALVPDPDKEDILASVRRLPPSFSVDSFPRLTSFFFS